jgi:ABC-type molybdate transport system ATPase subunit
MAQEDTLFPHLTVRENVAYSNGDRNQAYSMLKRFNLAHLAHRTPAQISGGERRRVALLRSWAASPRLLLLDEPLTGVDVTTRLVLLDALKELQREKDIPVLYVSHSHAECVKVGDTVSVMKEGQIVRNGTSPEVLCDCFVPGVHCRRTFENCWKAAIVKQDPEDDITRVRIGDIDLDMQSTQGNIGDTVEVGISSEDIIVSREAVQFMSARNLIQGTIKNIEPRNSQTLLTVYSKNIEFYVSLKSATRKQLYLESGDRLFLIIRARSIKRVAG